MSKQIIEDTIVTFGVHRGWDFNLTKKNIAPALASSIEKSLSKDSKPVFDVDVIMRHFELEFGFLGNFWEKWADGSLPQTGGIMDDVRKFLIKELS